MHLPPSLAVLLLEGRTSYLFAFFAGILWTLSFEPFALLPAGYLSFALPCLWVAYDLPRRHVHGHRHGHKHGVRHSLKLMAIWSLTAYLTSLYWVSHAVWLSFGQSPLGVVAGGVVALGLCLFLSLYALAAMLALILLLRHRASVPPLLRVGLFVCAFALAESLRGLLLGGFPWNFAGYAWNTSLWLLQTNALAGIELTSFFALASYALAALALFYVVCGARRAAVGALAGALAIPAAAAVFGAWRLADIPPLQERGHSEEKALVRIVQPNITQQKKWRVEDAFANFRRTLDLSLSERPESVALLLWPETTFPYRLTTHRQAVGQKLEHPWVSLLIRAVPRWLVFGAVRENAESDIEDETQETQKSATGAYRNSLLMIDALGGLQGFYDKVRLVPLGEFIPFTNNRFGSKIKTLTSFPSFARGEASPLLSAGSTLVLETQICYESIFPNLLPFVPLAFVRSTGGGTGGADFPSPDLLFNATNDGWFGRSSGPYQHLAMARVRAVERGLPFFRAANTGISAVFDPFGRELARLALGTEGWIDAPVPQRTERMLLTARFGNGLFWLLWFVVGATCLTFARRKKW